MKLATLLGILWLAVWGSVARADAPEARPNIIFILADDLGIDGVSCYGADAHHTPNIDALAASGTRFRTCYAAPLCGPSRCLLMSGRYAFRTGGLTNQSWRAGGPGAKSADEFPMAKMLKQAGYATCQSGKWRQVGEAPSDWGFDEYLTDNTASGWYWETRYNKNGKVLNLPDGTYGPNVVHEFAVDFIRRHKDKPFFLYYAMHLVHKPTLRTPDTSPGTSGADHLYDDNIKYMDKQVGMLVDELEKLGLRENTLLIFSGDNGTAAGYPSPVHGRMINGWKGSMLEGGARVPFIASWPAVTPKGKVLDDIVSFADPWATFAEIAGAKVPDGFKSDGQSFLPQLRGEPGTPRAWAYVQLGAHWYVREPGFKLNEKGDLFDMSDAPFVEKPIARDSDTDQSKAARERLAAALTQLDPAAGKKDEEGPRRVARANGGAGSATATGPWKSGDTLRGPNAPAVAGKPLDVSADVESAGETSGVIVTQGGAAQGYAIYLKDGKLAFAVRETRELTTIVAQDALAKGSHHIEATLAADGAMALLVDGQKAAEGKAPGPVPQQPRAGLFVGKPPARGPVVDLEAPAEFAGKITNVRVNAATGK
ncbi:MAG TPA: sulfatase-like hydrolase/transferase [Tepidisphaeraceae bacterium]|jgi:arylsulfatase A